MNKSQGYLKYSPKTLGNRISENWYLVLHCDEDIGKYYRYLFYIANFKPFDKAGSYGIQEWIGMIGIEKINGSFYNVMGLPVHKLYEALHKF